MTDLPREHLMRGDPDQGRAIHDLAKETGVTLGWKYLRMWPDVARKEAALEIARQMLAKEGE